MTTSYYQAFRVRQKTLLDLLRRARDVFAGLEMATWVETADRLSARVGSERFRVMILGEFKRGKSTLINALLRAEVLPSEASPCTAVINEVKWAEEKRAVLHFRKPLPDRHAPLPPDARRHLERHRGDAPPMDISVNDLQEFVKIPEAASDQAASIAETPYERVEVYWPLDLCREGVEIIDSPGLNEHHTRTKTTRDYLAHVDAVVFVMSVPAICSSSEMAMVDNDLRPSGHEYLFFVINRFDDLRRKEDREKIQAQAYAHLAERTRFGREGVYFVSALDALEGRLNGDSGMVSRSGLQPLERALERFLAEDRGRVKLMQPAANLARGLRVALGEVIPTRRKLLDDDLGSLRRRVDEARPHLEEATRKRDRVMKQVEAARQRVRDAVRREAERFFSDLSHDVPMWVRRMETSNRISSGLFGISEGEAKAIAGEVAARLQPAVEASLEEWDRKTLRPLLDRQMEELAESLNDSLEPFLDYLDGIKSRLAGGLTPPRMSGNSGALSLERVLTGTGGAVLGAGLVLAALPGMGTLVASVGLGAVVTAVAGKVGALLLSMVNPLMFGAMVMGALALNRQRAASLTAQVKQQVAEAVAAQLRQEAGPRATSLADEVYEQTEGLSASVEAGLEKELRTVREQVDAIIRHKEQNEAEVQRQRQALGEQESALRSVEGELNDLILAIGSHAAAVPPDRH